MTRCAIGMTKKEQKQGHSTFTSGVKPILHNRALISKQTMSNKINFRSNSDLYFDPTPSLLLLFVETNF